MSDMNWYDCIKSHLKVKDKLKHVQKRKKRQRKNVKEKEKLKEVYSKRINRIV